MTALIPWLTGTFGQLGATLIVIVGLVLLVRYGFWTIITLFVAWKVRRDWAVTPREGDR
ncbi:hypothetical protein ACFQL7_27810 [Halocatena marina]|uniref:Uncharacterized protein n=1 Tax=Halocatena marina TaxID=2934937 RepID=A0ABD5YVF9_9EURY